uniref:NADH dehydrogenase subunit 6 n=1 Tax=Lycosa singoriensis TaxID=434756 RepID=UPI002176DE7C|nr:NADH dehydrogenase subunit 6 [Lycosa singoriensis]UUC05160.1 NADH dehydrogenase subunit 6 [Lycosa singoriensis]
MMMLMFLFGVFFVMSMQPVFMVSMLIIITLFYSFFIFEVIGSYWFSYLLLLVMLSGVLVVFTYMVSLIPNESFEVFGMVFMFFFMFFFVEYFNVFKVNMGFVSMSLWESYLGMFSLFLISFLLVVMFLVVLLSSMNIGSVRVD